MLKFKKVKESPWFIRFYLSLETAFAGLVSYGLGVVFGRMIHQSARIGGLWCMISSLVVLQSLLKETQQAGAIRIAGSFIGALISGVVCEIWGYGYWQLAVVIFVSIYLMSVLSKEKAARLSSITAGVIVIVGIMHPDEAAWLNALARFMESLLGVSIAIAIVLLAERLGLRLIKQQKSKF